MVQTIFDRIKEGKLISSYSLKKKVKNYSKDTQMICLKNQVLIIHGPIGSGKTSKANEISEKAILMGYSVYGLLSLRVIQNNVTIGYDGLNLRTGSSFSLVRLRSLSKSDDWENIGPWKYAFNKEGFKKANKLLSRAASEHPNKKLIIIDEFGHIELIGRGIYQGFKDVIGSISEREKVVILCRTDKFENVLKFLHKDIKVMVISSSDPMFWNKVTDYFI